MKNKIKSVALVVLAFLSAIFWRMGGSEKYDKLWRRLGSSICMILSILIIARNPITWHFFLACFLIIWGSFSYFGFLNPKDDREYWYNFTMAGMVTQASVVILSFSWLGVAVGTAFALAGGVGKVLIDQSDIERPDVVSELYYGLIMCVGVIVNMLIAIS